MRVISSVICLYVVCIYLYIEGSIGASTDDILISSLWITFAWIICISVKNIFMIYIHYAFYKKKSFESHEFLIVQYALAW